MEIGKAEYRKKAMSIWKNQVWLLCLLSCMVLTGTSWVMAETGQAVAKRNNNTSKADFSGEKHYLDSKEEASATKIPPDLAKIHYGQSTSQVFSIWRPLVVTDCAPVLMYFHGGGFVWGTEADVPDELVMTCREEGIAVVSADYRKVGNQDNAAYPAMMQDAALALQTLRMRAAEWKLSAEKIGLAGRSAGGNIALWLALHDDLANMESENPVSRVSTRVRCVVAYNAQTSNDPWYVLEKIGGSSSSHPRVLSFYGIKRSELLSPHMADIFREASAINHVTADDPPVLLVYERAMTPTPLPEGTRAEVLAHHPRFGELLKERMDETGVPCLFYHGGNPPPKGAVRDFLRRHLIEK